MLRRKHLWYYCAFATFAIVFYTIKKVAAVDSN